MQSLFGKTAKQIEDICAEYSLKKFVATQITDWLYKKRISDISQMTNLSVKVREELSREYCVGTFDPCDSQSSIDGTKKYLFETTGNQFIESVYIPDRERATLCVSSQSGCRMGCKFCMTGRQGFKHNLTSTEILNQIRSIPESEMLTNVVYMGMGEPMDNVDEVMQSLEVITAPWGFAWSPSRITLSSIGMISALKCFLDESKVHLAISMHSPFRQEREDLMPVEKAFPIANVIKMLREYDFAHQRRLSFEYIVFDGINDTPKHGEGVLKLLQGLDCRVNLIRFHKIPDSPLAPSPESRMVALEQQLKRGGIMTTIRSSRGEDILAACGMLSGSKL